MTERSRRRLDRCRPAGRRRSHAKAPLDLIVWDSIATIELCETFLDFRQEHQTLNGIVDRSIWRQFANRLNHLIPGNTIWHTNLILLLVFSRISGGPTHGCRTIQAPLYARLAPAGRGRAAQSEVAETNQGARLRTPVREVRCMLWPRSQSWVPLQTGRVGPRGHVSHDRAPDLRVVEHEAMSE